MALRIGIDVGGTNVDRVSSLGDLPRAQTLDRARHEAADRAAGAEADPQSVTIVEVEDIPLADLPGNATRIRVKAVGDLKLDR